MRVNVFQVAQDGSNYYRMQLPALAAKDAGYDVELIPQNTQARECDVVCLNRPASAHHVKIVQRLLNDGYAVVVDMDDILGRVSTDHSLYPRAKEYDSYCKQACQLATLVTGSTQGVIDEYGFGHGVVIHNYVPRSFLNYTSVNKPNFTVVGWQGTKRSHPSDLEETKGGIAKALAEVHSSRFGYIGVKHESEDIAKALGIKNGVGGWGWFDDRDLLMQAMASMDIGIVPLAPTLFNDGKSWLKMMEFASVGVASVGSPSKENTKIAALGVGELAYYPNEWYRKVKQLLNNESYRTDIAARSKEAVEKHLLIENNISQWVDVWEIAGKLR